jgi:predicted permease
MTPADWKARVRSALSGGTRTPDEEVVEELALHLQALHAAARADGATEDEAAQQVRDHLTRWRADAAALHHRTSRRPPPAPPPAHAPSRLAGVLQDAVYACRMLRRTPRQALLPVLTMSLGIGVATTLFSVTYAVLVKPLPWPAADRIAVLRETRGGGTPRFGAVSNASFLAWRDEPSTIDAAAAWSSRVVTMTGAGAPARIGVTAASASLFRVLGVRPLIGSLFAPGDERSRVLVLSEGLWRDRFGASHAVAGTLVRLDGDAYTVVGVLPRGLAFPDAQAEAIVPFSVPPVAANQLAMFNALALLRPGIGPAQAAEEGTARARRVPDGGLTAMAIFGASGPVTITAERLRDTVTKDVRQPLLVLLAAVALLLLAATANVAGLQLVRAAGRRRELAIRGALGAGTARIVRQLLIESLLLGCTAGAAGLVLAQLLHRALPVLLPRDFPRLEAMRVDGAVLLFALGVSAAASVASGLLPALRTRRLSLTDILAEDGRAPAGAGLRSSLGRRRALALAAQVAIACILLVAGTLLGRSFVALVNADRGYDARHVLSARLAMPGSLFATPERRGQLAGEVLRRLAALPGVDEAAFTSEVPLTPGGSTSAFDLRPLGANGPVVEVQASPRIVSRRYFAVLGIRILEGRGFSEADTAASGPAVVVNEAFARRYLEGDALGRKLPAVGYGPPAGPQSDATVVGVARDVRYVTANGDLSQPEIYHCFEQMTGGLPVQTITLVARTSGDAAAAEGLLQSSVRQVDGALVAEAVMPLERRLMATIARPRLYAAVLGSFAATALVVAVVGVFGLLSFAVAERSRELAIRMALGARPVEILWLVARQGLGVVAGGLAAGMAASMWLTQLLRTQLYGIAAHDGLTFVLVPVLLVAAGALACLLPARRAARLDPLHVLRGSS